MRYIVHWNDGNKPRQSMFDAESDAALEVILLYQSDVPLSLIETIEQVRSVRLPYLQAG